MQITRVGTYQKQEHRNWLSNTQKYLNLECTIGEREDYLINFNQMKSDFWEGLTLHKSPQSPTFTHQQFQHVWEEILFHYYWLTTNLIDFDMSNVLLILQNTNEQFKIISWKKWTRVIYFLTNQARTYES